jgi:hypothetical protein
MGAPPSSAPKEGLNTGSGPRGSIGTGRAAEEERKLNEERNLGNSELDKRKQILRGTTAEFAKQNLLIAEAIVKINDGQRNVVSKEHNYTWEKAAELLWESIQQTLQHKK